MPDNDREGAWRYPPLVGGTLIRRYKRFLADVRLDDGREVVAHCPNTGAMTAVNQPGCRVWLIHSENPARKLAWTWELIELPESGGGVALASVNTGRANRLVEEALKAGLIDPLSGYAQLKREARVDDARLDFRLDDPERGTAYVEVKQVTLKEADGLGYFPDAVSKRGTRHLQTLSRLAREGYRAVLVFCVAHEGIDSVAAAAHIDPAYAEALAEARTCGVEVLAHGVCFTWADRMPATVTLGRRLAVRG
ncbi:DNA/RNA nuclease SfsA [Vreelandella jeotgali]|uniref:DNA/RNA nuclease SfsA n=1 Tax=Vreelandella jeotgali TaxID=553386 RepID=UPI0003495119|nr:DNA/RNA nuclease SfsA [Halomonas jeotgali]